MRKEIIINSSLNETRIAITEDGYLAEYFIEMPDKERFVGNVYLGKVGKIAPSLNAAFINVGLKQDAFLHFSDIDESMEKSYLDEDEEIDSDGEIDAEENGDYQEQDDKDEDPLDELVLETPESKKISDHAGVALRKSKSPKPNGGRQVKFQTKRSGAVNINLENGQMVIVQVVREAYSTKGMRVSTKIALPGRYTVLLPFDGLIGVSKKIFSATERKRLRTIAKSTLPEGFGCIIRTACQGKSDKELEKDFTSLVETWRAIEKNVNAGDKPGLLYQDMGVTSSVIRDLFTVDVDRVIMDSKKLYKETSDYLNWASPHLVEKLELYKGAEPIFDSYGIEPYLAQTYARKIGLPSGGSIFVDYTEALTVVDINSGRSVEYDQEQNAVKTNIEAIREIARQVRLRDLAGMIIVDCIDMNEENNKRKIFVEMRKELNRDRAKTVVYPLSQLGLLQITRQRIGQNIAEKTSEPCTVCGGTGRVPSKAVILNSIERWLHNFRAKSKEFRVTLFVNQRIAQYLTEGAFSRISRLMIKYFVKVKIQQSDALLPNEFKFYSVKKQKDITQEYN